MKDERARRRARPLLLAVTGVGVLGAVVAAWWLRPGATPATHSAAVDRLDALPSRVAYDSALVLAKSGHTLRSLPYFRRALRDEEDFWERHANYGSALYNLSIQVTERRGVGIARTRSTLDRVALVRESFHEATRARELARSPREIANALLLSSQITVFYGLPWETFVAYRQAQFANPDDAALLLRANQFQAGLQHPTAIARINEAPR